jgi:Heterokaryon incompatibility protein (HET)
VIAPLHVHVPPGPPAQIDLNPADIQLQDAKMHSEMFDATKYNDMRAPFGQVQDEYTYMPLKPRHIRLLRFVRAKRRWGPNTIVIRLLEVPLNTLPSYEALSYRWDYDSIPTYIVCEGKKLAVSSNCKAALEQFQIPNRLLWVDSICINQKDDVIEKNHQVSFMSEIYSSADRTLVWLGRDEDLAANCLTNIEAAYPLFRKESNRQPSKVELRVRGSISKLLFNFETNTPT